MSASHIIAQGRDGFQIIDCRDIFRKFARTHFIRLVRERDLNLYYEGDSKLDLCEWVYKLGKSIKLLRE